MTDRRRINGPGGGTVPPIYESTTKSLPQRPIRTRVPQQPRKIFLQTGLTPSASGSAYLELEPPPQQTTLIAHSSSLKLSCTVHGPRALPRSAQFSSQLVLTTHIKFAPFASRTRRAYLRDAGERDLAAHLESALKAVILAERFPKSGLEIVITILETEEDGWWGDDLIQGRGTGTGGVGGWGMLTVLAGCITVASAALVQAGIDCIDLIAGGVAAVVREQTDTDAEDEALQIVLDPCPSEHAEIVAACLIGYLPSRDEIVEIWLKGEVGDSELLIDRAVDAAVAAGTVLAEVLRTSIAS